MSYRFTKFFNEIKYLTYKGSLSTCKCQPARHEIFNILDKKRADTHLHVENNISNNNNQHEKQE